jgi:hypothetical protein
MLSGGGWSETPHLDLDIVATRGDVRRAAGAHRDFPSGGCIAWVRGSLTTKEYDPNNPRPIRGPRLAAMDPATFAFSEDIARKLIGRMGLRIECTNHAEPPVFTIHRSANAFVFSLMQSNGRSPIEIGLPYGAPVFPACANTVSSNTLYYNGPMSSHHVTRVFIEQHAESEIVCRIVAAIQHGYGERWLLSGLVNADVRFFPVPGTENTMEILRQPIFPYFHGNFLTPDWERERGCCVVRGVTGELLFSWQTRTPHHEQTQV